MSSAVELVKQLREKTGLGVVECKRALEEAKGDVEAAVALLKKRGMRLSEKKAGRETRSGVVGSYIHLNGRIGVLLEVNCETDFVAKTDAFKELVKDLTLQIAATAPAWIDRASVPAGILEEERTAAAAQYAEKPAAIVEKIVAGKIEEFCRERVLLDQKFIRDENIAVGEVLAAAIAKVGENIRVKRFVRFELGE